MTLDVVAFWMVVAMIPAVTAIPLLYHFRQTWWTHAYGQAFMTLSVGLALLVHFAVTFQLVPDFPAKDEIKIGVYAILLVAFWVLAVLLARTPKAKSRKP